MDLITQSQKQWEQIDVPYIRKTVLIAYLKSSNDKYENVINSDNMKINTVDTFGQPVNTMSIEDIIASTAIMMSRKKYVIKSTATGDELQDNYSVGFMRPMLEKIDIPPASYLDIGGGNGSKTVAIAKLIGIKQKQNVVTLDITKNANNPAIIQLVYDGVNLPAQLAGRKFDLITCFQVIHHVPLANRPAFLTMLKSLLAPSGHLIVREHDISLPLGASTFASRADNSSQSGNLSDIMKQSLAAERRSKNVNARSDGDALRPRTGVPNPPSSEHQLHKLLDFVHWLYEVEDKTTINKATSLKETYTIMTSQLLELYPDGIHYMTELELINLVTAAGFTHIESTVPLGGQKIYLALFR
jgi:2-polyprenyl-3-methyl-5-hydroxy-6-metoxy-1,4-benzoquinol methylase